MGWNGAVDFEKFEGGFIEWTDADGLQHTRMVLTLSPSGEMRLDGSTEGIENDTPINVFAGCNHRLEDCTDLHGNINNYGGQWRIPLENPVGYVNRFF